MNQKLEELIARANLMDLLSKQEEEKKNNKCLWVFAIIGVVAAVAAIAIAVYNYLTPDYFEDFDDEYDDEDDDFFEDDLD